MPIPTTPLLAILNIFPILCPSFAPNHLTTAGLADLGW